MNELEQQRAVAINKSKLRAGKQKRVDLTVWRKQNEESMSHFKNKLKNAVKTGDRETILKYLKMLYKLRAEQLQILFHDYKERFGEPTDGFVEQQIAKYYRDCYLLTQKVQNMLNLQHGRSK